jgi:hypothetical protein
MALHWSRSFALTVMLRMAQPGLADRVAGSVLRSYTPAQVIHALTGVYVFGFGAEDVVRREIYERLDAQLRGAFLRDQFTGHFEEARRRMADFSLEFCYATVSEFVLSDCPVVTYDKDSDVAGVLYGAPWGTADAIFMALGPHVVAALSRTGRYRDLSESELVQINKLQVRSAYKEMFFRPGSGLGDLIAEALLASRDQ